MLSRFALLPLFVIVLLNEISYQMILPIMNHVINITCPHTENFFRDALYGAGIAIFSLTVMLFSPFMGYLSDKYGRKQGLIVCMLFMLLSAVLFILSFYLRNILYFLIARFLSGIAATSTAIVQASIADMSVKRRRSVHFSTVGLALTIGLILGPLLGGYFIKGKFITLSMLAWPFGIMGVISLINIFLFMFVCRFKSLMMPPAMMRVTPVNSVNFKTSMKTARALSIFFSLFFILEFSWSLYYLTLPVFLQKSFFYHPQEISIFLSVIGVMMCLGLMSYRWISLYFSPIGIIQSSFGVFVICLIILSSIKNNYLNSFSILPITWSVALSYTALMGLISENISASLQGTLMGASLTVMALAWTITGFSAKFLLSASENGALNFSVSIFALLLGIILIRKLNRLNRLNRFFNKTID